MSTDSLEVIKLVVAFLSGGLAGAIFNFLASRHRQRMELALKVTEQYLSAFAEIGEVKGVLTDPEELSKTVSQNKVRKLGDWFELISMLYANRYLSKRFLSKVGLFEELRKFHDLITQQKTQNGSPFKNAWLWWPHFDKTIRSLR